MRSEIILDNTRLLLSAVADEIENGASPQALTFYSSAAEALANGNLEYYIAMFAAGEKYGQVR